MSLTLPHDWAHYFIFLVEISMEKMIPVFKLFHGQFLCVKQSNYPGS